MVAKNISVEEVFVVIQAKPKEGLICSEVAQNLGISVLAARKLLRDLVAAYRVRIIHNNKGHLVYILESKPVVKKAVAQLPLLNHWKVMLQKCDALLPVPWQGDETDCTSSIRLGWR